MYTSKLHKMKLVKAAEFIEETIDKTLSFYNLPSKHWRKIRTNNPLERILKEVRIRTKVVGSFPDGASALMLVTARLRHVATTKGGTIRYMDMDLLKELMRKNA